MMKKVALLSCVLYIKSSSLGMGIQIINHSGYDCRISSNLERFSCSINEVRDGIISCKGQDKSVELSENQSVMIFITQNFEQSQSESASVGENLVFSGGNCFFTRKTKFLFSVALESFKGRYVPVLIGSKHDPNTTLLRGENGFFMKRYMSPRFDRYIIEIGRDDTKSGYFSSKL